MADAILLTSPAHPRLCEDKDDVAAAFQVPQGGKDRADGPRVDLVGLVVDTGL